jgi:hypothetical protein
MKTGFSIRFAQRVPPGLFIFCLPLQLTAKRSASPARPEARSYFCAFFPLIGLTGQDEKCSGHGNRSKNKE